MLVARWILGGVFSVLALWVIALNWSVVIRRFILRAQTGSWIPLLGGICGIAALLVLPVDMFNRYWWIPALVDWGSVPGFIHAIVFFTRNDSAS